MDNKGIIKFVFELGQLKRIKYEGWKLIGVNNPNSVSEHTLRAIQIGFILAKLEKYKNPSEVCMLLLFHNIYECRIGNFHRVANRYVTSEIERSVKEQTENLENIGKEIFDMWKEANKRESKASLIAIDAKMLEQAFTSKELIEIGYKYAQNWIDNISKGLKTENGKILLEELKSSDSNEWWLGLKK